MEAELSKLEIIFQRFLSWAVEVGGKLLVAVLIIVIGYGVIKLISKSLGKILERSRVDAGAGGFIISVVKALCWSIVVLAAVGNIIDISAMVTALGAAGLTASFALQGSLSNFISGIQVIFSHPFSVGDYLLIDSNEGTVVKIDVLNTTLRTIDNKEVIIPNSKITSGVVVNYTSQESRRLDLSYGVAYSTDLTQAKKVISDIVEGDERIIKDPEPLIAVGAHNDSSIQIVVKIWTSTADYWPVYYDMQEKVKVAFDNAGINIPFPQLDVHNV